MQQKTLKYHFRLNESSPWQEYIYEFKVDYQARISLQDYNQQEIKYFYLKKNETEDLRKYYNLIIPTYQDSTQMFIGWKEEDGSVIEDQSDYTITQKGRITLVPQEMVDLPEEYIVQLQDKTIFSPIFATIYEYAFTNYVGDLNADIHVPDGIKKVELNDIFGKEFNGDFYISEIVDDISFGYGWTGPDLYGKYIVDENNPNFSSNEDGLLMDKSQTVILQTPIADAIYIPEGVTSISSSISWYVHDIYFEGKCLIDSHSFSNIPTDSTVHVPDQYYLDYFKKSYGSFVTSIVNENNESYDYTVSNNLVFSDDEKILVSTLDSASGTIVIPETVEKIADQAFSGNSDITQIILTGGNIELGHQIFKDSGVEDVMILTQDMPSVYKDTFSDSDNLKGISIARNYYHLYESKWSDLLEPTEFALLNETDSSLNVKDGFEYLEDTLIVDYDGNLVEYTSKDFMTFTLAYCMSIHKAQGNEFKIVIMPVLNDYYIMLKRNLIYTGLTRAKQALFILGNPQAFLYGIKNISDSKRKTTLVSKINQNKNVETYEESSYNQELKQNITDFLNDDETV